MSIKTLLKAALITALVALPAVAGAAAAVTPFDNVSGVTKGGQFIYRDVNATTGKFTTTTINLGKAVMTASEGTNFFEESGSNPNKLNVTEDEFVANGYYMEFDWYDDPLLKEAENLYSGGIEVLGEVLIDKTGKPVNAVDYWSYFYTHSGVYKDYTFEGELRFNTLFSTKTVNIQTSGFVPTEAEFEVYSSVGDGSYTTLSNRSYGDCSLNITPFTLNAP